MKLALDALEHSTTFTDGSVFEQKKQERLDAIAALRQAIVQPARQVPTTNYVQPVPDHCDRITWRNRYYHLPLAAALPYGPRPTFGAIGSRDVDVAEAQRAWDKAMAAQPAQVQINCDDCVYHYKDADQKPCAMCIHGTGLYDNFEPRIPAAQEVK